MSLDIRALRALPRGVEGVKLVSWGSSMRWFRECMDYEKNKKRKYSTIETENSDLTLKGNPTHGEKEGIFILLHK